MGRTSSLLLVQIDSHRSACSLCDAVQERAYVSGLTAANLVVRRLDVGVEAKILPVEADEPHITVARQANKLFKSALEAVLPASL